MHYAYGSSMESAEEAVEIFLETNPLFDGGGILLWDHREQRMVAAVEWLAETTHFGFNVRTRANAFYDDYVAAVATRLHASQVAKSSTGCPMRAAHANACATVMCGRPQDGHVRSGKLLPQIVRVPLPVAIRRRRLPFMMVYFRRSWAVMELMMASILTNSRSSISRFLRCLILPIPGTIFRMSDREPILRT